MPCLQVSSEHGPNSTAFRAGAQRHPLDWVASGGLHLLGWRPPTTTSVVLRLAAGRPPRRSPPGHSACRPSPNHSPCRLEPLLLSHPAARISPHCPSATNPRHWKQPVVAVRCLRTPGKHGPSKPHTPLASMAGGSSRRRLPDNVASPECARQPAYQGSHAAMPAVAPSAVPLARDATFQKNARHTHGR